MVDEGPQTHWDGVYARRDAREVSWFEPAPETSLALIKQAGVARDAAIVDVGAGATGLAAALLDDGYSDLTVVDISDIALGEAKAAVGVQAERLRWVRADVRSHDFGRRFDLWHDRAVFHFMVTSADRDAYLDTLRRTLAPGGHAIFATFGPAGPTRCSGLPACRYDSLELMRVLGADFDQVASCLHEHTTPSGGHQQFLYLLARRKRRP
jgi:SAM-dependent methyltransferase